ncbi:GPI14 [Candida oxycetoniae]|uniref:GPI mannosyltransferase 1 n=1 Tax=Candida oxycetoniae TaxID=497107 RepID=A0AAI9SUG3_9ASCO|nr:GPI14 [Candida oxycetoniae]KAI3402729.2 GPI14 [Candida oxycetoniae]
MVSLSFVIVLAIALRLGFFAFGLYQDEYMPVRYTDIDYFVFSDASRYVYQGKSPYLRETYRYTPMLALMLLPNNWGGAWYHFGKVLFMVGDIITGVIIAKLLINQNPLASSNKNLAFASIWLLNPMVITISTRGSSESILTSMIMLSLYNIVGKQNIWTSAFWLGVAIHFKIYPIIYLPSIMLYLTNNTSPIIRLPVLNLINWQNMKYLLMTTVTFLTLTAIMHLAYGREFLDNSYFYHFTRLDHRHNFSVYNMLLYYKSALTPLSSPLTLYGYFDIEKVAFLPQLALSGIIIPLLLARQDLLSCLVDGRRWNELRRFKCMINTHPNSSDGSSYVEQGNTKVICTVTGPVEPASRAQMNQEKANVEVNLTIANFSTFERKKRSKSEKRLTELRTTLERTFEQSILLHLYPRTSIIINVQVLSQDGGMLAAVANSITLALMDSGIAMYDYVSSISCGLYDQSPLLDLNNLEENEISSLTIGVIGKSEKLALLMLEDKMPLDNLEKVLSLAIAGSHRIKDLMDMEVRKHGNARVAKLVK